MSIITRLHHVHESTPKDRYVELRTSTSKEELRRIAGLEHIEMDRLVFVERLIDGEFGMLDTQENIFYRTAKDVERGSSTYSGTVMAFEDPEVKKYLVANIGGERGITNSNFGVEGVKGVAGEVTYEQVLACKNLDFYGNRDIRRFNELEYFKNLESFRFDGCTELEEISLPYLSATGISRIIFCPKLKKLTTRYGLNIATNSFLRQTPSLKELDTSKWTCSTTDTSRMFENCGAETLDLSNFDMSNVTIADNMFSYYSRLKSIKQNWNLSNLVNSDSMFYGCFSLTTLDTSRWGLESLINSNDMFSYCNSLTFLDTSKWKLSNLKTCSNMFNSCISLVNIDTNGWDLNNLVNCSNMFYDCYRLTTLDTSRWGLKKLNTSYKMFYNCSSLTTLDTSGWNLSNLVNGESMFYNCKSVSNLDVRTWGMNRITNIAGMFGNNGLIEILDTSRWANLDKVIGAQEMINGNASLRNVDFSDRLEKCTNYVYFSSGCTKLESMVGNHTENDNVNPSLTGKIIFHKFWGYFV